MKTNRQWEITLHIKWHTAVVVIFLVALAGCPSNQDSGSGSTQASTGCAWMNPNCGTRANEGSYECLGGSGGSSLMQCQSGQWVSLVNCNNLTWTSATGFTYACSCKGGCGSTKVDCDYGGSICGGFNYTQK